jgi:uncharacterized protein YuzB (UPF0349 family)
MQNLKRIQLEDLGNHAEKGCRFGINLCLSDAAKGATAAQLSGTICPSGDVEQSSCLTMINGFCYLCRDSKISHCLYVITDPTIYARL